MERSTGSKGRIFESCFHGRVAAEAKGHWPGMKRRLKVETIYYSFEKYINEKKARHWGKRRLLYHNSEKLLLKAKG